MRGVGSSSGKLAPFSETPLNPLLLLTSPLARWLAGGAAALMLLAFGWLYVTGLQDANVRLKADVAIQIAARQSAERNTLAIADLLATERLRVEQTTLIKETIHASPGGSVPADIRAALDGLRDR